MAGVNRSTQRRRRHLRIRKKITGTQGRPRLSVRRTLKHVNAQIIDDTVGHALLGISTNSAKVKEQLGQVSDKLERERKIGKLLGSQARDAGIEKVVFDRGGYPYHGRIRAFAEGAREAGLVF